MSEQVQSKVAMIVMAHQDDAEFGCAGTAALWAREGWDVYYVICADGGSGGPDDATDVSTAARRRIIETRMQEQRAACKILGVKDVFFLGYPDGQLQPSLELRRDLVRLLRRYRPTRVVCQSPDRVWTPVFVIQRDHADHLAVGQATLGAIYPASQNPWDFPELLDEGLQPHKVSEIYITTPPVVNFAVDISSTIELKMEALRAHASQVGDHIADVEKMVRLFGTESGKRHNMTYAEEFHRAVNR